MNKPMSRLPFHTSIITLFPEMFPGSLAFSLAGKAQNDKWQLSVHDLRAHGHGRHRQVDDTPAGGGAGMVLRADCLAEALDENIAPDDPRPRLLMSPRGRPFSQAMAREFAQTPGMVIICGRFEGVDQRVIQKRNLQEISIGDYILSGGELAALVMLDAIIRLLPGVMGNQLSAQEESFENQLLEHPHYTRPQIFEGEEIPPVLRSGDHGRIKSWRREQAEMLTKSQRPDLYARYVRTKQP